MASLQVEAAHDKEEEETFPSTEAITELSPADHQVLTVEPDMEGEDDQPVLDKIPAVDEEDVLAESPFNFDEDPIPVVAPSVEEATGTTDDQFTEDDNEDDDDQDDEDN